MKMINITKYHGYYYTDESNVMVFYGVGNIRQIYTFEQVQFLPSFDKDTDYKIGVLNPHDKEYQASNEINAFIRLHKIELPVMNLELIKKNYARAVICNETGQIFINQSQAALSMGINQGNLSRHLKTPHLIKKINGYSFKYFTNSL